MGSIARAVSNLFPYDPAIDTPMGHRNLILIYLIVWGVQTGYAVYALAKWRVAVKDAKRP